MTMTTYRILEEYWNKWGATLDNHDVTTHDIENLADTWGVSITSLMQQVTPIMSTDHKLLAAAPKLLDACQWALEFLRNGTPIHPGSDPHHVLSVAVQDAIYGTNAYPNENTDEGFGPGVPNMTTRITRTF